MLAFRQHTVKAMPIRVVSYESDMCHGCAGCGIRPWTYAARGKTYAYQPEGHRL